MIPVNVTMCFVNLDKFLIKDRFCTNKEFTRRRIFAPYNRGSAIDLRRYFTISQEPIKDRKITRQDRIFRDVASVCSSYYKDSLDDPLRINDGSQRLQVDPD